MRNLSRRSVVSSAAARTQWLVIVFTAATFVEGDTRPNESFVATTTSIPAKTTRSIRSGVRTAA